MVGRFASGRPNCVSVGCSRHVQAQSVQWSITAQSVVTNLLKAWMNGHVHLIVLAREVRPVRMDNGDSMDKIAGVKLFRHFGKLE